MKFMLPFLLIIISTNFLFSFIISSCLLRIKSDRDLISDPQVMLYSLGFGPIFTTLLLYYLFCFFPDTQIVFIWSVFC